MPVQPHLVLRPLRMAAVLFMGMATLCAVCTPFLPGVDTVLFLGAGTAYCLFLALFVVGLGLAYPSRVVRWWFFSKMVPLLGMAGFWLLLQFDPETFLQVLPGAIRGLLTVFGVWLAVGLVIAGSGWARYARRWSASAAERGAPADRPRE